MMSHIVESCPLTRLDDGSLLQFADDNAIIWLRDIAMKPRVEFYIILLYHHSRLVLGG